MNNTPQSQRARQFDLNLAAIQKGIGQVEAPPTLIDLVIDFGCRFPVVDATRAESDIEGDVLCEAVERVAAAVERGEVDPALLKVLAAARELLRRN